MDNRYFENVIAEMQAFINDNGFKATNNGFANDKKAFIVAYDDNRQMYTLSVADIEDGKAGEYKEINSWLFDDSQNAKDAVAVGMDFTSSLRTELGIKPVRRANNTNIDLPTASKSGSMDISGFTKKMLDVFPSLKDEYKSHVAQYGNFLYLNFFGEHLVPILKNLFETGTKKQIKKFYDVYEDAYIKGDKDTVNTAVVLLCAVAKDNEAILNTIREMLSENSHFLTSFNNFLPVFAKNKKLTSALIK